MQPHRFTREFKMLHYALREAKKILLFAHRRPDADTSGACLAWHTYLCEKGKEAKIACFDPYPEYLNKIQTFQFKSPQDISLDSYEVVIACDSVQRGFETVFTQFKKNQLIVLLDHHPDIDLRGNINILDDSYSSVCEIVYDYFEFCQEKISPSAATFLLLGILADTGSFQHANTSARVIQIASNLLKYKANISKIINTLFAGRKLNTLKLWGRALEKARIDKKSKAIITALTHQDLTDCQAANEDISQIASILNTVPEAKFSLVLLERGDGIIKGSLRSEEYKGIDVSAIARKLGGGGHKLASGFEIKGKIIETDNGWKIV